MPQLLQEEDTDGRRTPENDEPLRPVKLGKEIREWSGRLFKAVVWPHRSVGFQHSPSRFSGWQPGQVRSAAVQPVLWNAAVHHLNGASACLMAKLSSDTRVRCPLAAPHQDVERTQAVAGHPVSAAFVIKAQKCTGKRSRAHSL